MIGIVFALKISLGGTQLGGFMRTSQNKKRFSLKLSRADFFRFILLFALTLSILVHNIADANFEQKAVAATDEDSPYLSDDYDPVDYLPPGLPPSPNDPANDIRSVN